MITTKRPQSSKARQKADSFEGVLNSYLGSGYKQKDIDFVVSQKKDFNVFYGKVPPVFALTQWQVENKITAETKNFIMKTLYLLPETMRKELIANDIAVNKIIEFYSVNFETKLDISELDMDARKEIMYQAWFVFRLMERHVLNGTLKFSKYDIFARTITRIMVDMIPLSFVGAEEDPELNQTIRDIVEIVEPKNYLDLYLWQTKNILAPDTSTNSIIDAANVIIEKARVRHEPTPTSQESLDRLAEMGLTTEQVEIVARYTLAKDEFKDNYVFASVEQLLIGLEPFFENAKKFGWGIKHTPNLSAEEFEQLVSALFVMVDAAQDVDIPTFMGILVPMCYSCLLVNAEGKSVFEEPTFTEFSIPMFKLFKLFTSASCEVTTSAIPLTEPEGQNKIETQPVPLPASEKEAFSSTLSVPVIPVESTLTKEIQMTPTNATVPTTTTTTIEKVVVETGAPALALTLVVEPTSEEQLKKQFEDRKKAFEKGYLDFQKQMDEFQKIMKETNDRQFIVESKVLGDEAVPILERIRAQANERNHYNYASPSLTTTETVVVSAVAVVAVAAIGYSIYRVLND